MPSSKKHIIINKVKALPKKPIIQAHHITYEPERVVFIYKGEHYILTLLQWRRYVSQGMIEALKQFILDYEHLAVPLQRMPKPPKKKRRKRGRKKSRRR